MKAKISSGKGGGGKGGGDKKFSRDPDEKKDKHYFNDGVGTPGDFRFSDVPKPEDYLHTYRDLNKEQHIRMLNQLMEGTQSFVASLSGDDNWMTTWQVSAGFHYPVRPQSDFACIEDLRRKE